MPRPQSRFAKPSSAIGSRAHGCRGRSIKAERARRNEQPVVIMHERRASSDSLSRYPPLIYSDKYGSFVCPVYSCARAPGPTSAPAAIRFNKAHRLLTRMF